MSGKASAFDIVVASNRGPVSFVPGQNGTLEVRRGGGGMISGVSGAAGPDTLWVCAALSSADRTAVRSGQVATIDAGCAVRMLDIDKTTFNRAYNAVANSTLWFVHHLLYDTAISPVFDSRWARNWTAYTDYNAAFATAVADSAAVNGRALIQDYHLTLAPGMLRERRPDLRIGHFSHTPWAPVDYFGLLPDDIAKTTLQGVLGADTAGFLSPRWAMAFLDCCEHVLGAKVDRKAATVTHAGRTTRVRVHALGVDGADLVSRSRQSDVELRLEALRQRVGDLRVIVRIDRTELSKNIVRGLHAYAELLTKRPQWRGKVVHIVFAYPSRHDLPEYREYTADVQRVAREIDDEFATAEWSPILLEVNDDFPRSLAAYRLADVLVVNPIRDGMNLVAKEGPVLSDNGCALVLSREAGAWQELRADALTVNPYDVTATAEAMHAALVMTDDERAARCKRLAQAATALPPAQWFADQLSELND